MNFFNVICLIITVELLYFMYNTMQWNFYHGYALRNMKNTVIIIRMSIFTTVIIFVSIITKIISVSIILIFIYCLLRYIERKNLEFYQNNSKLLNFYILETKNMKKQTYISAILCYLLLIINFYYSK